MSYVFLNYGTSRYNREDIETATDFMRASVIAYAEAYNMMKCCEEDNDIVSRRDKIPSAVATRHEIEAIDKKKLVVIAADKAKIEALVNKKVEEKISKALENK